MIDFYGNDQPNEAKQIVDDEEDDEAEMDINVAQRLEEMKHQQHEEEEGDMGEGEDEEDDQKLYDINELNEENKELLMNVLVVGVWEKSWSVSLW